MSRKFVSCKVCGVCFETEIDEEIGALVDTCGQCVQNEICRDCLYNDCEKGYQCPNYKITRANDEYLIVLDKATTNGLIKFIFENRSTYEFKRLLVVLIKDNESELPF